MATKQRVIAACRQRWPGDEIDARQSASCPVGGERHLLIEQRDFARQRVTELKGMLSNQRRDELEQDLLAAARFVCDVNGDEPSVPQLRTAIDAMQADSDLRDELALMQAEWTRLRDRLMHRRCEVMHRPRGSLGWYYAATGDSWDECLEKIVGTVDA